MIELQDVLNIHNILINKFGGSKGVRDQGSLESAINRPIVTFDNHDLYPTPSKKAAAIFESILINHPFIDGNKSTAYVLMRLILLNNDLDIFAEQSEKYKMVISASKGDLRFDDIKNWIQTRLRKKTRNNTQSRSTVGIRAPQSIALGINPGLMSSYFVRNNIIRY